jgi:hypothetical protein
MGALVADVAEQRRQVTMREGFGPIAGLPESLGTVLQADGAARSALQVMRQARDRHARCEADGDVDVIGRVAGGEQLAVDGARLPLQEGSEPGVDARREQRSPMARCPDEVDEDGRDRVRAEANGKRFDTPRIDSVCEMLRGMEIRGGAWGLMRA